MKMRFWQKTYIFTLSLFLLCLNAGVLSLAVYTHQNNVSATEAAFSAEQHFVARSFEMDHSEMMKSGKSTSVSLLMQSYTAYYEKKGLFFEFRENGNVISSCFAESYDLPDNSIMHKEINGQRHIFISSEICDGKYVFVFAKNAHSIDKEFSSLMTVYSLTVLGVSAVLAITLYYILKKLSLPLEKLKLVTERIENGDFSVSAEEAGNDEFTLLARSFNRMLSTINRQIASLESNAENKQMLVDNMAHELRTPLTGIYGYAELLEKAALSEDDRITAIRYIMSEAKRLKRVSEMLLDSAFLRENAIMTERVDLSSVLSGVAEKLKPKGDSRNVSICCVTEKAYVIGNFELLSLLFYNLTENAINACEDGGRIILCCEKGKAFVEDNGKGIPNEQLIHITEPFYRTDNARSRADGGAGLGLALCKRICDSHNAEMTFESVVSKGTKISIAFTS